ncbi:MAG TPA: hypothetical protein VIY86_01275, partial [Pirellulaceae bacterium]
TPLGPRYLQGPQGGVQMPLDSFAVSDLSLDVYGSDGVTLLATADFGGLGAAERIELLPLPLAGRYFVRVRGTADDVQLYRLDISSLVPEPVVMVGGLGCLLGVFAIRRHASFRRRPMRKRLVFP